MPDPLHNVSLFIETGNEFLKGVDNVSAVLGRDDERFVAVIPGSLVSERRAPASTPLLEGLLHAVGGPFTFDIILKLREGTDNIAHEIADGILFVIFGC